MKITKYEHSCLDIEEQGKRLIIDPGEFSDSLSEYSNIAAVTITHVHGDHFSPEKVRDIIQQNPSVQIFTTQQVAEALDGVNVTVVKASDSHTTGPFELKFFGGNHELYAGFENVGICVNEKFYYPGDSYSLPDFDVAVLAAPVSAPWLRVPDALEFVQKCNPKVVFPTHNAILSEYGEKIYYRIFEAKCKEINAQFMLLRPTQSIEI